MRVLILSSLYPRESDLTSGIFIHTQAKILTDNGCKIIVVSPVAVPLIPTRGWASWGNSKNVRHEDIIEEIKVLYPRYLHLPRRIFREYSFCIYYYSIKRTVQRVIKAFQPDIFHAHTSTPDGFVGLLLRNKFALPLVVTLRGSDINVYPYRSRLFFDLTKKVISRADKVIAVSNALKVAAERIGSPQERIAVIYNGCDTKRFTFDSDTRSSLRKRLGIPAKSIGFLFIGHLIKKKGIFELLEAFSSIVRNRVDSYLIFVGHGREMEVLTRKVSDGGIGNRIYFVGTRCHEEIPWWLSMSDVLVLPSHSEGLPNVVLEAMACQRPVIATKVGGVPEAVVDGKTGILLEPRNPIALAQAMTRLAHDKDLRSKMGNNGRQIVMQKFSWDKNIENLINLYKSIVR